jgi:hypothetical protein
LIPTRAPVIATGQLFLNEALNEYLIVTKNVRGQIYYAGPGFRGFSEDNSFVERFQPVDPADVEPTELRTLIEFCPIGTRAATGYIAKD